jgi:hypothetical protein
MQPITALADLERWIQLSGDDPELPFDMSLRPGLRFAVFGDYSVLFVPEVVRAVCHWSAECAMQPFAMFFTHPDPVDYLRETGSGGLVATGADDPASIEEFLTHGNRWKGFFSPYDASHRFIVLPESRAWMFIGDRDADLAILGFSSDAQRQRFMDVAGVGFFETAADAAAHAQSFMGYALNVTDWL